MDPTVSRNRFLVTVTRGMLKNTPYASAPSAEAAELLREDAIKMGYRDATVISQGDFYKSRRSPAGSEGGSRVTAGEGR
jgi:hypothetical protein